MLFSSYLRKGLLAGVAVGALALGAGPVQAASVLSFIHDGGNSASDDNREYLIDRDVGVFNAGEGDVSAVGEINVGDSLRGLFTMNSINNGGIANLGALTGNHQWTGVFQTMVTTKACGGGICVFTFGPDPAFAEATNPGTMIVMYSNPAHTVALDFTSTGAPVSRDGANDDGALGPYPAGGPPPSADLSVGPYATEEAFIATAKTGPKFWELGFDGSPGEGWLAVSTGLGDNIGTAFTFSTAVIGATFNAGVTCLVSGTFDCNNLTGITAGAFGPVEVAFSGTVRGVKDLDTPFEASSDINASFDAIVTPEPAALGAIGMGLLGFGLVRRRRRA